MSLCQKAYRTCARVALVLALVLIALPSLLNAQTAPKAPTVLSDDTVPKWELFVGYQWLNPGGNVPDQSTPPNALKLPSMPKGFGTNVAYNFTNNLALEANYGFNWNSSYDNVSMFSVGPKLTYRGDGVNYFVHTLIGFERISSQANNASNGVAALLGGGMDLKLWKPVTLRLFEADFQWAHANFAAEVPTEDSSLRRSDFDGVRLTTGLVFNFGGAPEVPVAAACSIDHNEVMVGEPLHATVAASNFNPKHTLTYTWASNGGKIEGKDTGAAIDTNGVNAGSYTVTATVTDPKAKKNNTASCTANFTVKPLNPPQVSCSASPAAVDAGTPSTITCACTSPDNATVTVGGWTSSAGSIAGSGNSATLTTTGASAGPITVNATCTDSRGLTASTTSTVTVNNPPPPPPPPPQASKVNECEYPNLKKPWRVDNTCKAELDDVALKLQQDPDAKLVVVGNAGPKEKRKNLAAERALNVKAYISGGEAKQNIDPSRIETRTGNAGTATSEQWIVPAGATFPEADSTTPVDETKVKAVPDHPKPVAKKKAAKKAE
ncbi:MAG: hypothetical protein ABSG40_11310 [Terriglobales bacterium]|jgi:hypothetical protein